MQQWVGRGDIFFNLLIDINNSRFQAFVYMLQAESKNARLDNKSALCPKQQKQCHVSLLRDVVVFSCVCMLGGGIAVGS